MNYFEDERELRLNEFISSNKELPSRLHCGLDHAYMYKLTAASKWLGLSKSQAVRIAIDQLVEKIDQERGLEDH